MFRRVVFSIVMVAAAGSTADHVRAQPRTAGAGPAETDRYRRIELRDPATSSFTVTDDVSVVRHGARDYALPLAADATATGVVARDLMTGVEAPAVVVPFGTPARQAIRVTLPRPVPERGQVRLRVTYTARSTTAFRLRDGVSTFRAPVDVPRGSVVLPAGFELVGCNLPVQVLSESDGRVAVSFIHQMPATVPLEITARSGAPTGAAAAPAPLTNARTWEPAAQPQTERARLTERAAQDRDIVYFLQDPSTHAFSLYHDYTESRPGTDKYLNVVRTGARVSNPSAYILDTGEVLRHETLRGEAIAAAKLEGVGTITAETEVVVIHFPPVKPGQSIRLRISETYTAPQSYRVDGQDLIFERSLGRARNSVVLPRGWYLTGSSIPAVIRQTEDGLVRLDFVNGRPESLDVYIKARRIR